jgi:hypothetical protein
LADGETIEISRAEASAVYGFLKQVEGWRLGFAESDHWRALQIMEAALGLPVRRTQEEAIMEDLRTRAGAGQ